MAYKQLKFWFDEALGAMLSERISQNFQSFDKKTFIAAIREGIPGLELKDRVELIADALRESLPDQYPAAVEILVRSLGAENPNTTGMFKEYYWVMPIAKFVEKYGLDHYKISTRALAEITKRNTSEYAIRPYIEKYPDKTIKQMLAWSKDRNFHFRRLASEGGRPRLPWASKLDQFIHDPSPLLPILDSLKSDPTKFVQKSVGNCINDILKDNYAIGMDLLFSWSKESTTETKWIIKHALRNELKKENPEAQKLIDSF